MGLTGGQSELGWLAWAVCGLGLFLLSVLSFVKKPGPTAAEQRRSSDCGSGSST